MTIENSLSIEQKIGQLFFIGIHGTEIDESTRDLLSAVSPGGVCLFSRNIREAEQTCKLLDDIHESLPVEPFLSIDQEGGLVDRLRRVMTPMPAAGKLRSAEDARRLGEIIGETLRILGFNMDFAPVVDVIDGERSKFQNGLYSRAFSNSASDVIEYATEFLEALQEKGVVGCLKHFPGLGAAEADSHEALPKAGIKESELNEIDLMPYRSLMSTQNVHAIMVAHAVYPELALQETDRDGQLLPSSLSLNFVTKLLRRDLGFDGVVLTDDLEMGAIVKHYGIGDACKMAVLAGHDMLAICAGRDAIIEGFKSVMNAVSTGEITEDRLDASLTRISRMKSKLSPPVMFDSGRLETLSSEVAELNNRLD